MTVFAIVAVLLTILAVGLVVYPLLRSRNSAHPVAATVTAIIIPAAVVLVYLVVSNHDWRAASAGSTPSTAVSSTATPGSMEEAITSLERRLQATPGDEEGWILLGSSYLNVSRPEDAVHAYQRALELSGGSSIEARLGLAEAKIVLDPASLSGPVGDEIEAVLKAEPRNPKGLWYGGLLSISRGQPAVAEERWRTLLELSPPERVRQIIEAQLAELDKAAAGSPVPAIQSPSASPATESTGIRVTVSVSESLRARSPASAPLFVFVRDAEKGGPPLAVIRRQARDLPVSLTITDADGMLPGRSLGDVASATLVARIAVGGDPVAKPGDIYGEARWVRGAGKDSPIGIVIDQVVK